MLVVNYWVKFVLGDVCSLSFFGLVSVGVFVAIVKVELVANSAS